MDEIRKELLSEMAESLKPQIKELLSQGKPNIPFETIFGIPFIIDPTMPPNTIECVDTFRGNVLYRLNI